MYVPIYEHLYSVVDPNSGPWYRCLHPAMTLHYKVRRLFLLYVCCFASAKSQNGKASFSHVARLEEIMLV